MCGVKIKKIIRSAFHFESVSLLSSIIKMNERKLTVQQSNAPKKIAKIQFGTFDTDEIKLAAEIRVSSREIYQMPLRNPAQFGCLDPRLGISDKTSACKTCG
jgi:DNA-directed RNA polymerase beta' subunit